MCKAAAARSRRSPREAGTTVLRASTPDRGPSQRSIPGLPRRRGPCRPAAWRPSGGHGLRDYTQEPAGRQAWETFVGGDCLGFPVPKDCPGARRAEQEGGALEVELIMGGPGQNGDDSNGEPGGGGDGKLGRGDLLLACGRAMGGRCAGWWLCFWLWQRGRRWAPSRGGAPEERDMLRGGK